MNFGIERARRVREDLLEIWLGIAAPDIDAAERQLRRIDKAITSLADFPRSGPLRADLQPGVRALLRTPHLIFYRVDEARCIVQVIRVIDARRSGGLVSPMTLTIRPATPEDLPLVARLIRALADYEKLAHEVRFDEAVLGQKLFGPRPYAEVVIGEVDGVAQGFALFFHNFSTFEGKPGIYLEDLFVQPEARGSGLGKAMLAHLAALAVERDCARLEWSVLDWNEPAIGFYKSLGAKFMDEWTVMRVDGTALAQLGAQSGAQAGNSGAIA